MSATPSDNQNPPANTTIVLQDSRGAFSRRIAWVLAGLGWLGLVGAVVTISLLSSGKADFFYYDTTGRISESYHSGAQDADDQIAIIAVKGVIYDGDGFVKQQIEAVRQNKDVKAVVLRVDSPGGTVAGSDYMLHHLEKLRDDRQLPIVVSMGSIAASGGYYVSMSVGDEPNSIFAEPTTLTGSIGVIIPHYDISGLLAQFDIKNDSIASHPRKQMLSMTRPMTEENREILQGQVNEMFEMFKERVKEGRPYFRDNDQALTEIATGEVFTAQRAVDLKLVDKIGFIEAAIERAAEMAGLEADKVRVIQYNRPLKLVDLATFAQVQDENSELTALLELSSPRAYFLATSLPPLVRSTRGSRAALP